MPKRCLFLENSQQVTQQLETLAAPATDFKTRKLNKREIEIFATRFNNSLTEQQKTDLINEVKKYFPSEKANELIASILGDNSTTQQNFSSQTPSP